jgi:hypothetical protein
MKRAAEKMLVELKLAARIDFNFLYLGARKHIDRHITKATLLSLTLESACSIDKPVTLYNPNTAEVFTLQKLKSEGEKIIADAFADVMKKPDMKFLRDMTEYGIPDDAKNNDETKEHLARKVLTSALKNYINLRETDIENIISIILISGDDLRIDKEGEDSVSSYEFLREEEPYAYHRRIGDIFLRYRRLQRVEYTYTKLFALFNLVVEHAAKELGYVRQQQVSVRDNFESNEAFLKGFMRLINEMDITALIPDDEWQELRQAYVNNIVEIMNGGAARLENCDSGCEVCVYNRRCPIKWIKNHMIKLLKRLCFVDPFHIGSIYNPSLEDSLIDTAFTKCDFIKQ